MGHTQADMNKAMGQGIEHMQLLMMKTVFLGGLREEIQNRVLEEALTQPKLSVAVAHEIKSIPNAKRSYLNEGFMSPASKGLMRMTPWT